MGRRGPKPTPTHIKVLNGSAAHDPQRLNKLEPAAVAERPKQPPHLGAIAKSKWNETVDRLDALGVLSETDGDVVELYAVTYAQLLRCMKIIDEEGDVLITDKGHMRAHPAATIAKECVSQLHRLAAEMGLTPSARTRVSTTKRNESGGIPRRKRG